MLPVSAKDLLPQQVPFQFVDTLLEVNQTTIVSDYTVSMASLLLNSDFLSENALLENMAQTAAAGTGYYFQSQQLPIPIGYIGAIKKIKINQLPRISENIRTEINTLHKVGEASIVEGKIFLNQKEIASAELTIFVGNKN